MTPSPAAPAPSTPNADARSQGAPAPAARAALRRMTMLPEDFNASARIHVRKEPERQDELASGAGSPQREARG